MTDKTPPDLEELRGMLAEAEEFAEELREARDEASGPWRDELTGRLASVEGSVQRLCADLREIERQTWMAAFQKSVQADIENL